MKSVCSLLLSFFVFFLRAGVGVVFGLMMEDVPLLMHRDTIWKRKIGGKESSRE